MELSDSPIIVSSRLIQHHEWPFAHSLARLLKAKPYLVVKGRKQHRRWSPCVVRYQAFGDIVLSRLGDEFAILSRSKEGS